jgi:hypothetical protein
MKESSFCKKSTNLRSFKVGSFWKFETYVVHVDQGVALIGIIEEGVVRGDESFACTKRKRDPSEVSTIFTAAIKPKRISQHHSLLAAPNTYRCRRTVG